MKRYAAYEFSEYVNWSPDPEVQREFIKVVDADPSRKALIESLAESSLLKLYEGLVSARLHDVQLKRWVRQGVITKAWLASGEEAVTVGACAALTEDDVVGPMIRNAASLFQRGIPLTECFAAYLGTTDSITRGRDIHIGDPAKGVIPPISHIADLVPVMAGCAIAFKISKRNAVALTWTGDGSTATGAFHEGLRMACATKAPLVCIIQDNQVALGTRVDIHTPGRFDAFGDAYGAPLLTMDGNNVLDCYATTQQAVDLCRAGQGPVFIVARTFRMGGHATHDEREARALFHQATYDYWGKRDPVGMYEHWLEHEMGISTNTLNSVESMVLKRMDSAAAEALAKRDTHEPRAESLHEGVYA